MLDNPEKTARLFTALKASAVWSHLVARPDESSGAKPVLVRPVETVSDVSYLGDEGRHPCHIRPKGARNTVVVSLTHCDCPLRFSFAADALAYQKQPAKKLNKHMVWSTSMYRLPCRAAVLVQYRSRPWRAEQAKRHAPSAIPASDTVASD